MSLLQADNLSKHFHRGSGALVRAVEGVSFELEEGQTLSLIGESGSGKSTVGRMVLGLLRPDQGQVVLSGRNLAAMSGAELRRARSSMTAVFQEPFQSLNPQMSVESIVTEPLKLFRRDLSSAERRQRVIQVLDEVGLETEYLHRRPADLSGGQQQRIGIARALIVEPRLIVLDEPTSSLDLTVRATILNLLRDLQKRHNLAYLFISHDIATVRYFSDTTAVMYLGRFMEVGPTQTILDTPNHPYTGALLSSTLSTDPRVTNEARPLKGDIPSPSTVFSGCPLVGRCPIELPECSAAPVPLRPLPDGRASACIRADEAAELLQPNVVI